METFLIIVAVVVAIIVVVKMQKKKNSIEGLKNSAGYEVALQIKDALIQAGFQVSFDSILYFEAGHSGYSFEVCHDSAKLGEVRTDYRGASYLVYSLDKLREKNANAYKIHDDDYYHAIHNDNINLLAESEQESQEVPPFLEIVAKVMIDCKYEFHHPKWMFEHPESRKYLNVMFQD